jgi:hypothetical protein
MMGVVKRVENSPNNVETNVHRDGKIASMAIVQPGREGITMDVFEHHDVRSVFDAEVNDVRDARMLHLRQDLRLANEQAVPLVGCSQIAPNSFHNDGTSKALGTFHASKVDRPHPSLT